MSATVLAEVEPERLKWILDHQETIVAARAEGLASCDDQDPDTGYTCSLPTGHGGLYHLVCGFVFRRATGDWAAAWPTVSERMLYEISRITTVPAAKFGQLRHDAEAQARRAALAAAGDRELIRKGGAWSSPADQALGICDYRYVVVAGSVEDDLR